MSRKENGDYKHAGLKRDVPNATPGAHFFKKKLFFNKILNEI